MIVGADSLNDQQAGKDAPLAEKPRDLSIAISNVRNACEMLEVAVGVTDALTKLRAGEAQQTFLQAAKSKTIANSTQNQVGTTPFEQEAYFAAVLDTAMKAVDEFIPHVVKAFEHHTWIAEMRRLGLHPHTADQIPIHARQIEEEIQAQLVNARTTTRLYEFGRMEILPDEYKNFNEVVFETNLRRSLWGKVLRELPNEATVNIDEILEIRGRVNEKIDVFRSTLRHEVSTPITHIKLRLDIISRKINAGKYNYSEEEFIKDVRQTILKPLRITASSMVFRFPEMLADVKSYDADMTEILFGILRNDEEITGLELLTTKSIRDKLGIEIRQLNLHPIFIVTHIAELIRNARKAFVQVIDQNGRIVSGKDILRGSFSIRKENGYLVIELEDNGHGIIDENGDAITTDLSTGAVSIKQIKAGYGTAGVYSSGQGTDLAERLKLQIKLQNREMLKIRDGRYILAGARASLWIPVNLEC